MPEHAEDNRTERDDVLGPADKVFPEVMTVQQAAEYLQVNDQVLYRYIREGLIPVARPGKSVRLKKTVIDRWLELESWSSVGMPEMADQPATPQPTPAVGRPGRSRSVIRRPLPLEES